MGQVKALRAARDAAGSRGGQRAQTANARRAVADARRNAKAAAGNSRLGKRSGLAGRLMGGAARGARSVRDTAVAKQRAKRDAKTAGTIAGQRAQVRKAPARRAARQALRRSAARFHGRRLLAALLALPVGLLGVVSTWIGRKLGIPALIHPGRRLYRRMVQTAGEQRAARDETARQQQREQEAAADAEAAKNGTEGIAEGVERPAVTLPTSTNGPVSEGEHVSGFRFEEAASEMEQAATQYEPENAMEILAMVEGLPAALTAVANVMKILAERSDSEFPLEKEVADGFNDIFGALMSAVAVAEDMGPLFRQAHEQDRTSPATRTPATATRQRRAGTSEMSSTATAKTKKQQHGSGPVLDWAAGHGPVTGALSATTGAFAIATTGAATTMPPGWALAVGTAGALGHTVVGLRVRSAGRTLATRAASWLIGAGWTTWAMTHGPLTWAALGSLATIGVGIGAAARSAALYEEAREDEALAVEQRQIAAELSAERRAIAAEWVDRIQRVCSITVRVLGVEMWETGAGYSIDAELPQGGATWSKIAAESPRLSADARLPHGCTATASPASIRGA